MIVIGPGQKCSIIVSAFSFISFTRLYTSSLLYICTISGLSLGLPLASYIFFTAFSSKAFAPNPYTVSVGNITVFPSFINSACFFISFLSIFFISILLMIVFIFSIPAFISFLDV